VSVQSSETKALDLGSDPDFKGYRETVTHFALKHRPKAANNFCIIGYSTDNTKSAWVWWRERQEIILWEAGGDLDHSRRTIHLKSDVVATDEDLHGSTFLVTRSWVNALKQNCEREGVKVHTRRIKNSRQH